MQDIGFTPPIYELHVNPTYAVCIPQRNSRGSNKTLERIANEANLRDNSNKGVMSKKATRRITNAVNWLVASAKKKWTFDKLTNKRFTFKVNFITLTLPTLDHGVTDNEFKSVLLHNFINTCRYKYDLKNYVWKVETQANGNIHAHFTTDTFIHWKDIRSVWNTILTKNGIIKHYQDKHKDMTLEQYISMYDPAGTRDISSISQAYYTGAGSNWSDPNSTDVHSVYKIKDIASYLAKYMGKSDEGRRKVKGRLWGCSTNLSETNKLMIELTDTSDYQFLDTLYKADIKYKRIESKPNAMGETFEIGSLFLYKLADWGTKIKGKLLEKFNEHRFNIRYNINIEPPPIDIITPISDFIVRSPNYSTIPVTISQQSKLFLN